MGVKFTDPQIQHLMEYGDEDWSSAEFDDAAARDREFSSNMSRLKASNDKGIREIIADPRNDLTDLANAIREKLRARGFIEVHTPIFVSKAALAKMTITEDHPLYKQVFFIDDKRALRPMHAMNLYAVMRKLRDHTDGPVKIFEIGSCFRKESKSSTHLEEFTMLNLVELGPDGDAMEHLRMYIGDIMDAVGVEYTTTREESDVYVETLDVEVGGTEVASGAIGPHRLDPAHDIHEPWAGVGFGLERLLMLKNSKSNVRKTGKSITYVNGCKMDRGIRMVSELIAKAERGEPLGTKDVLRLMSVNDREGLEELFAAARRVRDKAFGKKIFTYGFVYFSTHCRNNCTFCYFRRSNQEVSRYRKSVDEIVELSASLQDAGINLSDLTMGEDPVMYADDYKLLLETISAVHEQVGISIMASPGALPERMFPAVREAGADWYACYQETYNRKLFESLRLEQSFDDRRNQKIWARKAGLLTEDGMMIGLGESIKDRADTIVTMGTLGCDQVRAMTFVPQAGTPMKDFTPYDSTEELKAIAVMRLLNHDKLIPCSLDVEGIAGLRTRIDAGANVVTSIVPPSKNLAGVAQHELDIENGNRSVEHVFEMLDESGHRHATSTEYRAYLDSRRRKMLR